MFKAEGTWGVLKGGLSSRQFPETSMSNWFVDLQAFVLAAGGINPAFLDKPLWWSSMETVQDWDVPVSFPEGQGVPCLIGGDRHGLELRYLHDLYIRILPEYEALWQAALDGYWRSCSRTIAELGDKGLEKELVPATAAGLPDAYKIVLKTTRNQAPWDSFHAKFESQLELAHMLRRQPSPRELGLAKGLTHAAARLDSITVAIVTFEARAVAKGKAPEKAGDWVMARPEEGVVPTVAHFGNCWKCISTWDQMGWHRRS